MTGSGFEARALELLRGAKPNVSEAARRIAEDYPYPVEQVDRVYHDSCCNDRVTRAYLDLCVCVSRENALEPRRGSTPAPAMRELEQLTFREKAS